MKKLVLVVDDERFFRNLAKQILDENKFEIREAVDGEDGVRQALLLNPDLVIMDLGMPGYNGFEAICKIKAERPACKILVCTVHAEAPYQARAYDCGAAAFLSKRLIFSRLITLVESVLEL